MWPKGRDALRPDHTESTKRAKGRHDLRGTVPALLSGMREQFFLATGLFHVALLFGSTRMLGRWRRHLGEGQGISFTLTAVARDLVVFGLGAGFLAVLAASVAPPSEFTVLRLLSQALFAETLGLAAALAVLARRLPALRATAALVAASLAGVYVEAYHREPTDLKVRHHQVDLSGGAESRRTIRIVHMSDLQTDGIGAYEERVFRTAMALRPDLVLMTGDYIQPRLRDTRARATGDLRRLFERCRFRAPLGVYAVRGDVDDDWPAVLERTGVVMFDGEVRRIVLPGGRGLSLIGLTPGMSRGVDADTLVAAVRSAPPEDLRLVFGHNPDFIMKLAGAVRVDLALAGHTHGGQVVLPFFGAPITKSRLPNRFASGLHDYHGIPLHVSAGIGMERGTAPQIRFLCPPEISLIEVAY